MKIYCILIVKLCVIRGIIKIILNLDCELTI